MFAGYWESLKTSNSSRQKGDDKLNGQKPVHSDNWQAVPERAFWEIHANIFMVVLRFSSVIVMMTLIQTSIMGMYKSCSEGNWTVRQMHVCFIYFMLSSSSLLTDPDIKKRKQRFCNSIQYNWITKALKQKWNCVRQFSDIFFSVDKSRATSTPSYSKIWSEAMFWSSASFI